MNLIKSSLFTAAVAAAAATSYAQSTTDLQISFEGAYDSFGGLFFDGANPLNDVYLFPGASIYGKADIDVFFDTTGTTNLYQDYAWFLEVDVGIDYSYSFEGDFFSGFESFSSGKLDLSGGNYFSVADLTNSLFGVDPEILWAYVSGVYGSLPNPGTLEDVYNGFGLDGLLGPAPDLASVLYYESAPFPYASFDLALIEQIDGLDFAAFQGFVNLRLTLVPVPEPSTYGLIGAGALVGLIGFRRFKARKQAA